MMESKPGIAWRSKLLGVGAMLLHLSLLVSWRAGHWNRFTFDATATHGRRGWDFYAVYQAGHNVLTDVSIYESDNDKLDVVVPHHTPYRYLPVMAYTLGVLLNAVPPLWAFRLWVAVTEMVWLGCAYLSWRLAAGRARGILFAALWLCFTPYYLELYLGQFSVVQGALILVMLLTAGHPVWRFDLAWTASLLWKQNTGLFVPLLVRLGRWRTLALAGAAVLVTSGPYFALYPAALPAFLTNLRGGPPHAQLGNLGVRQWLYSFTSALFPTWSPETQAGLQTAWVGGVLVIGLWLTFATRCPDPTLLLCFWTTTYFLVYHDVWEHHYVLLVPVFVMLYARAPSWFVLTLYGLVALWTPYILIDPQGLSAFHMPMRWTPLEPRGVDVAYHACKAVPTLILWVYLAVLLRRPTTYARRVATSA